MCLSYRLFIFLVYFALRSFFFFYWRVIFKFFWKVQLQSKKEGEKDLSFPGLLCKCPLKPRLDKSETRSQRLPLEFSLGCRDQALESSSAVFPDINRELEQRYSSQDVNHYRPGLLTLAGSSITHYTTMSAPRDSSFYCVCNYYCYKIIILTYENILMKCWSYWWQNTFSKNCTLILPFKNMQVEEDYNYPILDLQLCR